MDYVSLCMFYDNREFGGHVQRRGLTLSIHGLVVFDNILRKNELTFIRVIMKFGYSYKIQIQNKNN